jgi:hypothetical protein
MLKSLSAKILASLAAIAIIAGGATAAFQIHEHNKVFGIFGATANIPSSVALFETSLANSMATNDTSAFLVTATDRAGTALSGYQCFLVDGGTAQQEYMCGTMSGTTVTTLLRGIDPQNPYQSDASLIFSHRRGADVKITDYPTLAILSRLANGTDSFPNVLTYATAPSFTTGLQIVDKTYVDNTAFAGAPNGSTTVKGIYQEATTSQINAGTASGSTGADLTVQPAMLAASIYNTQLPTANQKLALAGQSGTAVSGSNLFEDFADTATISTANKLVRTNGSGLIDTSFYVNPGVSTFTTSGNVTAGQAVVFGYQQTDGGIKIDTSGTSQGSITIGSNSNRGLMVFLATGGGSAGSITSVTFAGSAMTQLDSIPFTDINGHAQVAASYYISAPPTGSGTLTVNMSSGAVTSISYTSVYNVSQSGQPEAHTSATKSTTQSTTLATVANGAAVYSYGVGIATSGSFTSFSGTGAFSNASSVYSSGVVLPAATTVTSTATSTASSNAIFMVSLAPATAPTFGIYPASSATSTYSQYQNSYAAFIGFSNTTTSAGGTATVAISGLANTGISGLTTGMQYYLNNTAGTIGTTTGTNSRKVGISTSSTSLLITNIW